MNFGRIFIEPIFTNSPVLNYCFEIVGFFTHPDGQVGFTPVKVFTWEPFMQIKDVVLVFGLLEAVALGSAVALGVTVTFEGDLLGEF